ncbi:ABC transporter permease [Microbacterium rhizomatis]|uniref:ABC transporter permease n=1 Tax=Microbacterium rhizomatis TaxID=1631477 RepID=A0A5J5IX48_9MICO|nr:ABC transporter permease [Microbacterium rhizomatis]KAA9105646.1 ABC transporter permease [Microbacterium rhizomatis]
MYWTYLRRELAGRKRQTAIVAVGLAIAIALVIIVNSLAAGVRDAQAQTLESVYGVGTDLTVTGAATTPGQGGGAQFDVPRDGGTSAGGTTTVNQSRLMVERQRATLDASTLDTVTGVDGVGAASGALSLTHITFSGELPTQGQAAPGEGAPPQGGADGAGGSRFNLNTFTVLGIDPGDSAIGPLASVTLSDGRALTTDDNGQNVAVVDSTYASTNSLAVGSTIDVGGTTMEVVGIVTSSANTADTAANVYIPLDVAQSISGAGDVISTVYVQASSSSAIDSVQSALQAALPDATVSSEAELASSVSSSLSSASSLISNLGTWLSIIVLAVAVLLAVLFTISGVSRRTREFGTLKAIGWSNGRVVGQVAGESMVQGVIGGAVGLIIGLVGIWVINIISPTISTASATTGRPGGPGGAGGFGGGGGRGAFAQSAAADVVLHAPLSLWIIVAAIGLAILGGLVAGAFGGWRAARLSPAEALRSVN